jgi:hypothetical protein
MVVATTMIITVRPIMSMQSGRKMVVFCIVLREISLGEKKLDRTLMCQALFP